MGSRAGRRARNSDGPGDGLHGRRGLAILIPGYGQWLRRQQGRSLVLFGSFASSLVMGGFAWGTWAGLAILGYAYGTHVASAADVIRQEAFPGFGRWVPWASASAGLGLTCYGPALALALIVAWPGFGDVEGRRRGYLIDRSAYWRRAPTPGDWAWLRLPGRSGPEALRVLAGPGQSVEWSSSGLRVEGLGVDWIPPPGAWRPRELAFRVPAGLVLVALKSRDRPDPSLPDGCGWMLVPIRGIGGRAWARLYPIRERGPLP